MFIDNQDGTYTIRHQGDSADCVTVDRWLPINANNTFVYANGGQAFDTGANSLWAPLLEKAYAQVNHSGWLGRADTSNDYSAISDGVSANVFRQITGLAATAGISLKLMESQARTIGSMSGCQGNVTPILRHQPPRHSNGLEAMLAGDRGLLRSSIDEMVVSFPDPEGLFYNLLILARVGDWDRAVEILALVVERGFFPYDTYARHAWLDPLRERPDFIAVLQQAERRHGEARAEFIGASGEAWLGAVASSSAAVTEESG